MHPLASDQRVESAAFKPTRSGWKLWAAIGGVALLAIVAFIYIQSRPPPSPRYPATSRLRTTGIKSGRLAPTGARLFLAEYGAGNGIVQVANSGGEVAPISAPSSSMVALAVSPDGSTILVADEVGQTAFRGPLWALPVLGGSPRRLGDAAGQVAAWSPDGQKIVFGDGHDLTMANSDGSAPTKLFSSSDASARCSLVAGWLADSICSRE